MNTLILPTMEELRRKSEAMQEELVALEEQIYQASEQMDERLRESTSKEANCKIVSEYLEFANGKKEVYDRSFIKFHARITNTMAQYHKYYLTPTPETYKFTLLKLQVDFLQQLSTLNYKPATDYCEGLVKKSAFGRLAVFEDVNCDTHSELWMPGIGTITFNCHYMEAVWDPWTPLPIDLKMKLKEDLLTGEHVGGSVAIGASTSIAPKKGIDKLADKLKLGSGPEKLDVKVGGTVTVEWDSEGVTDVSATVGVKGQLGSNVKDGNGESLKGVKSVSIVGVNQTFSLKSGPSTSFKSSFGK